VVKRMYAMCRASFGKVGTPVKVHSARLPPSFLQYYGEINGLDGALSLSAETAMRVRQQMARLNVCEFCIDANRAGTIRRSMDHAKFDTLGKYRTSRLFHERERAALEYVTELTKNKRVGPEAFARLARSFSERAVCEIGLPCRRRARLQHSEHRAEHPIRPTVRRGTRGARVAARRSRSIRPIGPRWVEDEPW
jgi:hypothetical protein